MIFHVGKDFDSIQEALDASRKVPSGEEKVIQLDLEKIFLQNPVELDERDNGLKICGNSVIYGGCQLNNFVEAGDGLFAAEVLEGADPEALIVDGRFCERSRYPEEGRLTYKTTCDLRWMSSTNGGWDIKPTTEQLTTLQVCPEDLPEDFEVENAYITVYHEWDESTVRIASYDRKTGFMRLKSEMEHPAGSFRKSTYVIWGIREGMTKPGQWYFDHIERKIVYYPLENENIHEIQAVIPLADHAFCIRNAENITLSGFTVSVCNNTHERAGLRSVRCYGAIDAEKSSGIKIDQVAVVSTAGHGIRLFDCADSEVTGCHIENCGAGGIFEYECAPARILNNYVGNVGMAVASSIGIHAGGKSQLIYVQDGCVDVEGTVEICGNTIYNTPYCAITCSGGPHIISKNRIEKSMAVLNDGGAIYCSRANGTCVSDNYITRVAEGRGDIHGAYAIYYDEMSYNSEIKNNIVEDVRIPLHFHYLENISIANNVFVNKKGDIRLIFVRAHNMHLKGNVICAEEAIEFCIDRGRQFYQWSFGEILNLEMNLIFSRKNCYRYTDEGIKGELEFVDLPKNNGILRIDPKIEVADGEVTAAEESPLNWLELGLEIRNRTNQKAEFECMGHSTDNLVK